MAWVLLIEGKNYLFVNKHISNCFYSSGVSHSAMTDMQAIQQEGVTTTKNISLATKSRDFFDDYNFSGFSNRSKYEFKLIFSHYEKILFHLFSSYDTLLLEDDDQNIRKYQNLRYKCMYFLTAYSLNRLKSNEMLLSSLLEKKKKNENNVLKRYSDCLS